MIYPDEEKVTYDYNLGGQVDHVRGYKSYGYDYVNSEFSGGNTSTARFSLYVSPYLVAGQGSKHTKHILHFRAGRKSFSEWFGISAHGESRFPSSLAFPRRAKVVSRVVWHFRTWRKSFPEWFGISAHGESHFPSGWAFPHMAKVVSRVVWHFRAGRKSFPEWFGISAHGESHFPSGLAFPRMAKVVSRVVWRVRESFIYKYCCPVNIFQI